MMSLVNRSMLLALALALMWAAEEALLARVLARQSVAQAVWLRFMFHVIALFVLWGWRDPASLWRTRRPVSQLARSLCLVAMPVCWLLGLRAGGDTATMLSVFWIAPLLVLLFARWWLGERASLGLWLAAALGSVGACVLLAPATLPSPRLLVHPLGMAAAFSAYVVMTASLRSESTRANLFYAGFGACLALAPLMPWVWVAPALTDLLILAAVALLGLGGLLALQRLVVRGPLLPSLPLLYLQLPFAVGMAWSAGAVPLWHTWLGSTLICTAAAAAWALEVRRQGALRVTAPPRWELSR